MSAITNSDRYYTFDQAVDKLIDADDKRVVENKLRSQNLIFKPSCFTGTTMKIMIGISTILALGGVYLLLAGQRILPHRINAITNLEMLGTVGGAVLVGTGALTVVIAIIAKRKAALRLKEWVAVRAAVRHNALEGELTSGIISDRLEKDEIFVIIDSHDGAFFVFTEREKGKFSYKKCNFEVNDHHTMTQNSLIQNYLQNDPIYRSKKLVSIESLAQRNEQ